MLDWLLTPAALAVNLHAVAALVFARGDAAAVRRWARRSGWFVVAFVVLSGVVVGIHVRQVTGVTGAADPAERAAILASHLAAAMNCGAFCGLASVLPVGAALWLHFKSRRAR
jgi:bacteriorhodopsin